MPKRPDPSLPLIMLVGEVIRVRGRFKAMFGPASASMGLKATEAIVLATIVKDGTPQTVSQLGRAMRQPRQPVQKAVNALLELGLIEATANPHHRRAPLFSPTVGGIATNEEIERRALDAGNKALLSLDPDRCRDLAEGLRNVTEIIDRYLDSTGKDLDKACDQ